MMVTLQKEQFRKPMQTSSGAFHCLKSICLFERQTEAMKQKNFRDIEYSDYIY